MPYCHKCGSQVAENIVFCPYCGVNQTSDAEDGGNFSPAPINSANEKAADESQMNHKISAPEEFQANQNKEDAAVALAAENDLNTENENSELSEYENSEQNELDQVERRQEDLDEDLEKAKYENFQIDKQTALNESEDSEIENLVFVPGENEIAQNPEIQSESEMMSYEEAEIKEGEEFQDAELKTPENSSNEQVNETETPSEDLSDAENAVEDIENEDTLQNLPKSESAQAKPISKPEIELESAEANCPPPLFDSVRIMEKPLPNKISETGRYNQFAQKSAVVPQKIPILEIQNSLSTNVDKNENKISYTAQNISEPNTDGRKSAKLKPLEEGIVLNGRYEIVRKIGGGGMGAVYLASDKNLGGVLRAVKEMVQSYIEDEQQEKAISDFKRESLLLTSLEHQSIPTIYDYFFDEKEARFYLVMKYISGGDLASRLRSAPENRIEEKIVTEWAIQIADVLDYLHNRQPAIIYRDLKPSNVMVDGGNANRVMLVDFGIARWVNKEEKGVTAVGTMGYAPPELFSGNVEPRSDIYSLGSTLFHLLTGADPQSNPLLIFDFQKHPRPRQINPQISDQMEKILMRAVEYSAERRFSSAAELRDTLIAHLDKLKANKVSYGVKETPAATGFSDQYVFCGFCGQKIVANDLFCAFCGAKQPLAQNGVNIQQRIGGQITAQISILGTSELDAPTFQLEKDENLVGRRDPMSNIFPEIDLSKFDPNTKISRRHARIWRDGNKYLVEDLGSSNGTIVLPVVNEMFRLAPHQPVALNSGDKLKLGDTTLHFVVA